MRKLLITLTVVIALCLTTNSAFAGDPNYNDAATCVINVTVDQIVEWEGAAYAAINLATIDDKGDVPDGNSVYTLWLNCNVSLTADNTAAAELDNDPPGSDTLVTEYKVTYDGDGDPDTGGTDTDWATYNNFISGSGSAITHVDNDGAVEIRLRARASNRTDEVADAGDYTCTQTLTATWASD